MRTSLLVFFAVFMASELSADGPADNLPDNVRQIPPPGITISDSDHDELSKGLDVLAKNIEQLKKNKDNWIRDRVPDVEIFFRAVDVAIKHGEFFAPGDVKTAKELLRVGLDRAERLARREAPWMTQVGPVARGFVSSLDGTVQPYVLLIPNSYAFQGDRKYRLDLWLHGRGETLSENNFLGQPLSNVARIAPVDTFVLHPYGRYSNAFKFAGEVDVFEALEHAKKHYRIDDQRIAVRGFSMGGAGCWQLAVHYPDHFFAANPGAGFSETPEFLKVFQQETLAPTWYEEKLWQWYDCPGYAANLFNLPTIAYSGELDAQKQAADVMEKALAQEDITLLHQIGPQTKHAIHADSAREIERRLAKLAELGHDPVPRTVKFVTYTLKYPRSHWVQIDGLERHWEQARIEASLAEASLIRVKTTNVSGFSLSFEPGRCPFPITEPIAVEVNGTTITTRRPLSDRSWSFHIWNGQTGDQAGPPANELYKRIGSHGPIDDAFMHRFVVVRPTGPTFNESIGRWFEAELDHFVTHWRRHFRGEPIVKSDREITDEDIASANLILFGDPSSNQLIGKMLPQLPIEWTQTSLRIGDNQFPSSEHVPVLVYPNPLNPRRYVVLNSGFTFREFAYLNNARQVPKLPDWAIIDTKTSPNSLWPGNVVAADFFDERWQVKE